MLDPRRTTLRSTRASLAWLRRGPAGRVFPLTETQRSFVVTLVIGASCGLLAVAFHQAILAADRALLGRALRSPWPMLGVLVLPMLGGLAAGLALTFGFPAARGSGIPQVKWAFSGRGERLRLRDATAKFVITSVQIGAGASLGREGPTVHMCATLAGTLGRWFALPPETVRRLLPVGAAAGVAAAFNAPIAAVTFTVEEIVGGLDRSVLSGVVVAAAVAAVIEHSLLGAHPVFDVARVLGLQSASSLPLYAVLGVLAGALSIAFHRALLGARARFRALPLPEWSKPGLGGLLTGACGALGLWLVGSAGVAGGGYAQLSQALEGALPLLTLLVLGALKLVATVLSYSSGGAGGVFAPTLFIGAMLGGAVGWARDALLGRAELGDFALVGMGALFAGVIRAPITSVLIIFEMTDGYALVLPLMLADTIAFLVARHYEPRNLYDALLAQDGMELALEVSERPLARLAANVAAESRPSRA